MKHEYLSMGLQNKKINNFKLLNIIRPMNHTVNVPTCDYINYFKKMCYLSLKLLIICGTYDQANFQFRVAKIHYRRTRNSSISIYVTVGKTLFIYVEIIICICVLYSFMAWDNDSGSLGIRSQLKLGEALRMRKRIAT